MADPYKLKQYKLYFNGLTIITKRIFKVFQRGIKN